MLKDGRHKLSNSPDFTLQAALPCTYAHYSKWSTTVLKSTAVFHISVKKPRLLNLPHHSKAQMTL